MSAAESQRTARLAGLSARWRPLMRRAYAGDLRAAIRCSCLVCAEWDAASVRRCRVTAPTLPLAAVEARASASPRPGVWAAAWAVAWHVGRLESDLDRVLLDLSRLRSGHAAEALRAYLAAECGRRRDALCTLRRQAAILRATDPTVASDAEAYAAVHAGEWVEIPGGSARDG